MKDYQFLKEMYADSYFPTILVDKVKDILVHLCNQFAENPIHTIEDELIFIDETIEKINVLENEFYAYESEIETAAREAILGDVIQIMKFYNVRCDFEEATGNREW